MLPLMAAPRYRDLYQEVVSTSQMQAKGKEGDLASKDNFKYSKC